MANYTINDLAKRVMQNLGIDDAFEDVSAEDFALISSLYQQRYETLFFREWAYWPLNEIDGKVFIAVSQIVAEDAGPALSKTPAPVPDEDGRMLPMGTKGLKDLKRIVTKEKSGLPVRAEYF